jgi:hypothetical protein
VYSDSPAHSMSPTHGMDARLASRRLARWAAIVVHLLGVIVPGFLMITTEGPAAGPDGASNVSHARMELALIVVFAVAQGVALIVWRHRSRAVRVAAKRVTGPLASNIRVDRGAVKVAVGMLLAVPWLVEIGYVAQAFTSMSDGGYNDQASGLAMGMIVVGAVLAFVGLLTGGFALLAARTNEAAARDMRIAVGLPAAAGGAPAADGGFPGTGPVPAPLTATPDTAARIAALSRMRRRATVFMVVSIVLMVGLVALAAVAVATHQWQLRYAFMIPTFFLISLSRVGMSVRARRATATAIARLSDRERGRHVAQYATGYGQGAGAPVPPAAGWGPGR